MTERELGSESVACPTCGRQLAVADTLADGSTTHVLCTNCHPAEKAADTTSTPRETGTNVSAAPSPKGTNA